MREGGAVEKADDARVNVYEEWEGWRHVCSKNGAFEGSHSGLEEGIRPLKPEVVEPVF